ncbi:MAG: hypothetical protein Q9168_001755 [Polycauliona sp. 1 TL-2023]
MSPPPMSIIRPIFIASIGNPSPTYTNTLHSAGHTVLNHLLRWLFQPNFEKSRPHASGLLSASSEYTLWQSPSLMNLSGKPLSTAWRTFLSSLSAPDDKRAARLVVVHDELELPIGKIKVRQGKGMSAKGHNGLKSVLVSMPGMEFTRIGVGIGRCASRESRDVAAYVMRKMTPDELEIMADVAGQVSEVVREMRRGVR